MSISVGSFLHREWNRHCVLQGPGSVAPVLTPPSGSRAVHGLLFAGDPPPWHAPEPELNLKTRATSAKLLLSLSFHSPAACFTYQLPSSATHFPDPPPTAPHHLRPTPPLSPAPRVDFWRRSHPPLWLIPASTSLLSSAQRCSAPRSGSLRSWPSGRWLWLRSSLCESPRCCC